MKRHALTIALSASVLAITASSAFADFTLNILHINDLHSRIEAINKFDSTCSEKEPAENACFGGVAREIVVPVDHVVAIYARENGQGMAFPPPAPALLTSVTPSIGLPETVEAFNRMGVQEFRCVDIVASRGVEEVWDLNDPQ